MTDFKIYPDVADKGWFQDSDQTTPRNLDEIVKGEHSAHGSRHTAGTDDIQDATASQKGLMTAAYGTKLDGIEALADVTASAGAIMTSGNQTKAGKFTVDEGSIIMAPKTYTPAGAGTATLDLSLGNNHEITMPAGNITVAISNETDGQYFCIDVTQDGVGSRTITWFSTIRWDSGVTPVLTTTASKRDSFGFKCTGVDTYDGFIIGQGI